MVLGQGDVYTACKREYLDSSWVNASHDALKGSKSYINRDQEERRGFDEID